MREREREREQELATCIPHKVEFKRI